MRYLISPRKLSGCSLAASVLVMVGLASSCSTESQSLPASDDTQIAVSGKKELPVTNVAASPMSTDTVGEHERTVRLEQYLCSGDSCSENEVLVASSLEEAEWLLRNGYPSSTEQRRLEGLSLEALEKEAETSDSASLALAQRYADAGDADYAMSLAMQVADAGGIYAYHRMSGIMSAPGSHQDLIDSAAYLRVAHLLGDHRASEALARMFPDFGPVENVVIDRRATGLYTTMARNRAPEARPYGVN